MSKHVEWFSGRYFVECLYMHIESKSYKLSVYNRLNKKMMHQFNHWSIFSKYLLQRMYNFNGVMIELIGCKRNIPNQISPFLHQSTVSETPNDINVLKVCPNPDIRDKRLQTYFGEMYCVQAGTDMSSRNAIRFSSTCAQKLYVTARISVTRVHIGRWALNSPDEIKQLHNHRHWAGTHSVGHQQCQPLPTIVFAVLHNVRCN